ncbi:MAG: alcohol dehydrogenase [Candidatus Cloacimonadota bacterium]|nr:MAG: alcohol dehydrogenase [Candidatus Cloacimonadota bacterium]
MYRYFMPTKVFFGNEAWAEYGEMLNECGKKALIVTGKNSARISGALDDVLNQLKKYNKDVVIFDEIRENPDLTEVEKGRDIFKNSGCDFIIGIGGGSPLDAAKAIGVTASNNLVGNEIYEPAKMKKICPIIAVPTTSGTGSEVTSSSVISNRKENKKAGYSSELNFPKLAYVLPKYTMTLSEKVTRDTATDALSHLLEGLYSHRRSPVIEPIIHRGVSLIYHNLITAMENPNDEKARENLMLASVFGGMTIAQTGTTLQHSIGYPLTAEFGISHGLANGLVMKDIMELYYPFVKKELNDLFMSLNIAKEDFYEFLHKLNLTADIKIDEKFLAKRIPEVMKSRNMNNNPFEIKEDSVRKIYLNL